MREARSSISIAQFKALFERLGRDDPETVKLTGIYHNLIRIWAEV
ncbi:MAG: hypothetical protein JWP84_3053 [Tardiphaga sp.]|nr:hypothetical protein [Tardiphaga sp.]